MPPIPESADELREPPVFASVRGVLDLLVIAKAATITQFSPYQPTGWVYEICRRPSDGTNQCPEIGATGNWYGGTRLQLSAGDLLKIHLVNRLPTIDNDPYAAAWADATLSLNPTNIHLHGMLVSPRYATADDVTWGDNVFVYNFNSANGLPLLGANLHGTALNDEVDYSIPIPRDHPSGLYWFHPHIHGISQNQISAGLSGILTVGHVSDYACEHGRCGSPDTLLTRHLILKDSQVLADGTLLSRGDSGFCGSPGAADAPGQGGCAGASPPYPGPVDYRGGRWFFTINGQQYPTITVGAASGQIWRIVNASANATYRLNLWDPVQQREMLMRVISIDGVSVDVRAASDPALQTGNRFEPEPCPNAAGEAGEGVCTKIVHLMPSSRAELEVVYRDANGTPQPAPPGATAVLRTSGYASGPQGDTWPAVDLAKVRFSQSDAAAEALTVTGQTSRLTSLRQISDELQAANADVPADPTCRALPPTHKRRIFFGWTAQPPRTFGLGYEEIDAQGQPVPGTFLDIRAFDPGSPTVCVPLGADNLPVAERWELVNLTAADHNFHIHQAHFSVLSDAEVAGTAVPDQLRGTPVMMDSLPLVHADSTCQSVADWRAGACTAHPATVEIHFAVAGDFVYHCHIIEHEDAGMMAVIRVRPGIASASAKQPLTPRIGAFMCRVPRPALR
jgi:FtsP/CotA-like multicopper oxidase with cupredoxin domain